MLPPCLYTSARNAALNGLRAMPADMARAQALRMIAAPILSEHSRGIVAAGYAYLDPAADIAAVQESYEGLMPCEQRNRAKSILRKARPTRISPGRWAAEQAYAKDLLDAAPVVVLRGRPPASNRDTIALGSSTDAIQHR